MSPIRAARHGLTLGWRSLLKLRHSPDQLLDVLLLPVTFVLVFVFLFGKAVAGDWHAYLQFVLPGIAVQALLFVTLNTAVTLNADLHTGIFDRFRSLPIARSAPLTGHVLGDLAKYTVSLVLVFGFGAILGFRPHGSALAALAGCGLIFPLTFGSNVFVPTAQLPGWLQAWVKVTPVTQVSNAARGLLLDLPLGHTITTSLLWIATHPGGVRAAGGTRLPPTGLTASVQRLPESTLAWRNAEVSLTRTSHLADVVTR